MTTTVTFTASEVFSMITLPFSEHGGYRQNAVVEYITEYFGDNEYSSVSYLVRDLQMSNYSDGSIGMIYTYELDDFIAGNLNDIEDVLNSYMEAMGEDLTVKSFGDMVVIALDVAINEIASAVEHADLQVIINAVDYMDPNPEVIICERVEADDKLAEIMQHRLDMEVQHSTSTLSEEDYAALEESIFELVSIVD
jgi:hypothetical protein